MTDQSYGHPCVYQNRVPLPGAKQSMNRNGAQPQNPVVVHNMPFFHHPLVQHYNNHRNNDLDNDENEPLKTVPLHIPVPPQAFLKFFSL